MASERPSAQGKHLRFPKLGRGNGNSLRRLRCAPQRRHGERGNDTRHGGIRGREHSALVAAVWHTSLSQSRAPVHLRRQGGKKRRPQPGLEKLLTTVQR